MINVHRLYSDFGQSIWLDYFDRNLLELGGLESLILDGVRGAISNPRSLLKAIAESNDYDETIRDFLQTDQTIDDETLYQWLLIKDARNAADVLRPVYDSSGGGDGFVNVDMPAYLAYNAEESIESARHLWRRVNRSNAMIKVPATKQGIVAIEALIAEGINVNATHLFSLETYKAVTQAYLRGLASNPSPENVRSVASFYLSELDAKVDNALEELDIAEVQIIKGKTAIAGARMAYQFFRQTESSQAFKTQLNRGAKMQRLLWAGTSPTNQEYSEKMYVEQLIGGDTVVALALDTLDAFIFSGNLHYSLESDVEAAQRVPYVLESLEIDLPVIAIQLEEECIQSMAAHQRQILAALSKKRHEVTEEFASMHS